MADVSETELAYVAGILDGEGCIGMTTIKSGLSYAVKITVGMTDFQIPILLKEMFGGNVFIKDGQKYHNNNWKPIAIWSVKAKKAEAMLVPLLPYLRVKKEQALLALKFQKTVTPGRGIQLTDDRLVIVNQFRDEFKRLNLRGRTKEIFNE